jgi:hypothetical protein
MSKVDLNALKNAAAGNPREKVMVSRGYLKAIHDEIAELRKRPREEELTAAEERELNEGMDETFGHVDKAFASMDKMFGNLFGKGSGQFIRRKIRTQRS